MPSKFLRFFRPFTRIMPEAKAPDREVSFKEKLIWTAVVLVIYLIMSNIPLYGIDQAQTVDYFYWMRVILASQRGRLTEFGIGPIVTAGLVMQLLVGSKIINVDMTDPVERGLFSGVQKVMAILLTIAQAIAYLLGGAFGDDLTATAQILVFVQLLFATMILMLMDEMIQKGWGLGSGVSLFIGANVAGQIIYNAFSFFPDPNSPNGPAYGAIIAFFQSFFTDKIDVFSAFFRRKSQPDMLGVITTIVIFLIVVWFESMRIEIPLSYKGYSGFKGKYPMKLMYVSNIPVILSQALYANILFFAQLLAGPNSRARANLGTNSIFLNIIGTFREADGGQQLIPESGLAYYLTPPQGISSLIYGEFGTGTWWSVVIHAIVYLTIFTSLCVVLGKIWIEVSGLAPRDIARQILGSKMQIDGFRSSEKVIEKILARYIPTLTVINGIIVAVLSFGADFLGALGSGTGLLLLVGIMQNFAETIAKEAASEQYPTLAGFMGK
ncbi:MAG: preprotein translocase subunit SecY [Promethearchaeota archaeon]